MKFPFCKTEEIASAPAVDVFSAPYSAGLNDTQVAERVENGLQNLSPDNVGRTTKQIFRDNLLTYFNAVFVVLAACIVIVHASILNLSFLVVVFVNAVIGIVQELRSKKALDALSILQAPQVTVIRNGLGQKISIEELVRDDIVYFTAGNQICADARLVAGSCLVNEALVTGEADEIPKKPGNELLSGSFLLSGACYAQLTAVGENSFVNRLTAEAKRQKKSKARGMVRALNDLVKWIGVGLLPVGAVLMVKEILWLQRDITSAVTSTVGALVGMIPEGVYLLTSLALVAGVLRLSKKKTLCRRMDCIEALARTDVLCVDKTGTITENKMVVEDVVCLCPDRFIEEDIRLVMADYVHAMHADNETMAALHRYFTGEVHQEALEALSFTSSKKYGGVSFHEDETWLLGAPEVLLGDSYSSYSSQVEEYSSKGCRVLLLTLYDGHLTDSELAAPQLPVALILLANKIRPSAPDTFAWFAEQGVSVCVISGDNPVTVSEVAARAGIENADRWVDARTLQSDGDIALAVENYRIFGRVTPEQKRRIVLALKAKGHTISMTGDGVNDVLALKEADCSVAVASGSDAASQVAQIVLMNSDFSSLPDVVAEGRRVINNIERSASLYLVKNIFSLFMAVISVAFVLPYPLNPAQLGLVNCMTIGMPAFLLAMEPNENLVRGRFMKNVLRKALPAALTDILLVGGVMLFYLAAHLEDSAMSTICVGVMGVVGFLMVYETAKPCKKRHWIMIAVFSLGFVLSFFFARALFNLATLDFLSILVLAVFALLAWPAFRGISKVLKKLTHS